MLERHVACRAIRTQDNMSFERKSAISRLKRARSRKPQIQLNSGRWAQGNVL